MGMFSFISRWMASSEDRSPWGEFWFEPVSARTASGARVSADSAMRLAAVYACVRILSETMASLPVVMYRARADGGKEVVTNHWLHRLLHAGRTDTRTPSSGERCCKATWCSGAMPTTASWPTAGEKSLSSCRSTPTGSAWS